MSGRRLVLADDDALARSALVELLSAEPDQWGVTECGRPEELGEVLGSSVDLVLLADSLESGEAYEVCSASALLAPVLVLARGPAEAVLLPALEAGALGVVAMTATYSELVASVRAALRGEVCIPPGMLGSLLRDLIERRRRDDQTLARYRRLTTRERQVLGLLARGADVNDMASELVLAPQTIRSHLQHVLDKLEVHSRAEAVEFVLEHDLLDAALEGQP